MQETKFICALAACMLLLSCEKHHLMNHIIECYQKNVSQECLEIYPDKVLSLEYDSYFIICGPICSGDISDFIGFVCKVGCIQDDQFLIIFCRGNRVVYHETFLLRKLGWRADMSGKYESGVPLRIIRRDSGPGLIR